jgi:DNA-binding transcriptional regulator YhcF (GntR family)
MSGFRILTSAEQVAEHLRKELAAGVWSGEMPGVLALAGETGINHKTVDAALTLLEREGLLASQGARKPRRILRAAAESASSSLNIGFLLYDREERHREMIIEARHRLNLAGHHPFFAKRSLTDLNHDRDKVAAFVEVAKRLFGRKRP